MKAVLSFVLILLLSISVTGEVVSEEVEYRYGEEVFQGYLTYNDALSDKRPGILIVHEWWGLNEHPKQRARQLAQEGYVAFALDMYGKGRVTDDPKEAGQWASQIRKDPLLARQRFEYGLNQLQEREDVDSEYIAAIGYCFGGGVCLDMARMGLDLKGVVSFHGGLSNNISKDHYNLTVPVLVCHGGEDPMVPPSEVKDFFQEMNQAGADWQLIAYGGAVHSFTNPEADQRGMKGVAYNEKADQQSWMHMLLFFRDILNAMEPVETESEQ